MKSIKISGIALPLLALFLQFPATTSIIVMSVQ